MFLDFYETFLAYVYIQFSTCGWGYFYCHIRLHSMLCFHIWTTGAAYLCSI